MSYLNKIILFIITTVLIIIAAETVIVTRILFTKSIEHTKAIDIDKTSQITNSIKTNFDYMTRLLNLTQQSLAELDFRLRTMNVSVSNILKTLLALNPDVSCTWLILEKGAYYEDRYYIKEFFNQNGAIIENLNPCVEKSLKDPNTTAWFFEPLKTGRIHFDPIILYDYGSGPVYTATISAPISANGKVIGVFGLDMFYKNFLNLTIDDPHKDEQSASIMLLSQDMTILHAYDRKLIDKNLADFSFVDIDNMRLAMEQGNNYSDEIISPFLNEKVFLYIQPILLNTDLRQELLYLYISTPLNIIKADSKNILFLMATTGFICILFVFGIMFYSANKFLHPIKALTHRAKQITEGDFSSVVFDFTNTNDNLPANTKNEIVILQYSFLKMLHALQENFRTIEKCVEERTQELYIHSNYIKQLIECTSNISIVLDKETNIIYCSNNILDLFGTVDLKEVIGIPLRETQKNITDKGYLERCHIRISRIIAGESAFVENDVVTWPNGEKRLYQIIYRRTLSDDGNLSGMIIVMRDLTDVRLEEAKYRINDVLHSTLMPCLIWDKNGNIVAHNEIAAQTFGIPKNTTPDDFNRLFFSIQPEYQPDKRATEDIRQKLIHDALTEGFAQAYIQLADKNGNILHFNVSLYRLLLLSEYRLIVYYHDRTDIMIKEAESKEAEERIKLMFDATPLSCVLWNESHTVIDCNEETLKIFALPDKQTFLNDFMQFAPEFQPNGQLSSTEAFRYIQMAFEKGHLVLEWMNQDYNGKLVPTEITLVKIKFRTNFVVAGYIRDLREYKKMMAETDEANERIKFMLDSTPLMCVLRDDQGNIIDCNQAALRMLGISDKDDFCKNFDSFFPEFQPDESKSADGIEEIMKTLNEEGFINFERTFQTPAGEIIPVASEIRRIPWNNTHYYLSFSRDLREIKATEQKMQESLERERHLKLQKEAAQAADEAKSRFLANMSHEIRTPMNAILGMVELLYSEKLNSRQFQYVKDLKISAMALLGIINDILDISKIQTGKLNLVPVHYDFNMFIDNIASVVHFLIEDKNLTFKLFMQDEIPPYLYGDDIRLRQILLNLLGNAIKFTPEGDVCLLVDATDTNIHFTVSDTGIGIKEEDLTKLFEVFEQVDIIKNRNIKGAGLGLAITKSLVEMMDGRITVESVYNQGSSFHVEIPKVIGDEALIYNADNAEISMCAPDAKILVVDDNIVNLNVACGLLQLYQITAESATSGEQAIELIQQNQYDLVFMDHRMPGMDGIETTKLIRELGINVPVIALTASVIAGAKEILLESGMNDYLSKPIIKNELNHMLKKWLPREKHLSLKVETIAPDKTEDENHKEFWEKIGQIEELSLLAGLNIVDGQRAVYERTLKLMTVEIEKCAKNLNEFLTENDMQNFCIEVHSIKGALANIGAGTLSSKARELEIASDQEDIAFCAANLSGFIERLNNLNHKLKEAFAEKRQNYSPFEIPPELPLIFEKLENAFDKMDFVVINNEIKKMDALNLSNELKEETEQIKDAVLVMDYEKAASIMQKLLHNT